MNYLPFLGMCAGRAGYTFTRLNGGIGIEHYEQNNVQQWEEWGFDYLKYDWDPVDPVNADLMKQALLACKREFAYCMTVYASPLYALYWSQNCASWRNNADSGFRWSGLKMYMADVDVWADYVHPGNFYDLDMLDIGPCARNGGELYFTEWEELFAYTLRAFFMSPIQVSCYLEQMSSFEFDMVCDDEILSLHQDSHCDYPHLVETVDDVRVYRRTLENGDAAIAIFNMGDDRLEYTLPLDASMHLRDVWAKEDLPDTALLQCVVRAHCVRVFRLSK